MSVTSASVHSTVYQWFSNSALYMNHCHLQIGTVLYFTEKASWILKLKPLHPTAKPNSTLSAAEGKICLQVTRPLLQSRDKLTWISQRCSGACERENASLPSLPSPRPQARWQAEPASGGRESTEEAMLCFSCTSQRIRICGSLGM